MNSVPNTTLSDGGKLPQIGLGLWQITDKKDFKRVFNAAIKAGYRHFDTAQVYGNEGWLGEAIANSGLPREQFWITTKVSANAMLVGKAGSKTEGSFVNLRTDYIDLLLVHFPVPIVRKSTWQMLEKLHTAGKAHSIGVSNYGINHLKRLKRYATIMPAVNQIEMHVFLQRPDLVEYCHENGIAIEAYSPLAHSSDTSDQIIQGIAAKHGKSYAQVMLRWCIQQGAVVLPKSVTPSRITENIDIFSFTLDSHDMAALQNRNRNMYTCRPTISARFIP